MDTMEQGAPSTTEITTDGTGVRRGWYRWLAGILVLALVGAGIWLAVDGSTGDDLLPADVQAALDAYEDAWQTTDEAAFLAATTTDYVFVTELGETDAATQAFTVGVRSYWKTDVLSTTATGEGPYLVTRSETVYPSALSSGTSGESIITIEEAAGAWQVSRHVWTERP